MGWVNLSRALRILPKNNLKKHQILFWFFKNLYRKSSKERIIRTNYNMVASTIWQIFYKFLIFSGAATRGILWKKMFLEISQNAQEKTCARVSFFNKVAGLSQIYFAVNLATRFLRTPFLLNTSWRLLLYFVTWEMKKVTRSSYRRCSIKKVFLKILQNSQESTCARVSFSPDNCFCKSW